MESISVPNNSLLLDDDQRQILKSNFGDAEPYAALIKKNNCQV